MSTTTKPLTYTVGARRVDAHGSQAECKRAAITLDTDLAGRDDAFNPAELLLAALAACMLKGIDYRILVDTDEADRRLALLHDNVRKYGTVFNTVAPGTILSGTLTRMPPPSTAGSD